MKRKAYIWIMKILMLLSVAITCSLVIFVIGFVLYKGLPNITWKLLSLLHSSAMLISFLFDFIIPLNH